MTAQMAFSLFLTINTTSKVIAILSFAIMTPTVNGWYEEVDSHLYLYWTKEYII